MSVDVDLLIDADLSADRFKWAYNQTNYSTSPFLCLNLNLVSLFYQFYKHQG
jgi:hypothetical protein